MPLAIQGRQPPTAFVLIPNEPHIVLTDSNVFSVCPHYLTLACRKHGTREMRLDRKSGWDSNVMPKGTATQLRVVGLDGCAVNVKRQQ